MIPSQKGIGIRKGDTGGLDAGQQILPHGQVAPGNDYLSAGEFVDRPLLDRINPFTPFGSKKFVPSAHGQNLIDHYETTTGKNVRVLPNQPHAIEFAQTNYGFTPGGYFHGNSIIGGGRDPFGRDIYLREDNPRLWVGAHELGHAFDPHIMHDPRRKPNRRGRREQAPLPTTRAEAAEHWQAGPLTTYQSELVAQKAAKDYYDLAGLSDSLSEGPLISYPKFYVDKHLREAESPPPDHPAGVIPLAEDTDYQQVKKDLLMKAAVMADKVFNPESYPGLDPYSLYLRPTR